jgi:hypothetical protein
MFAAQSQGRPDRFGELGLVGRSERVIGCDARDAVLTKSPDEATNRRARQPQQRGDLTGLAALLPEPEHGLADRSRDGTWHR